MSMSANPVLLFLYRAAIALADTWSCFFPSRRCLPAPREVDIDAETDEQLLARCKSVSDEQWSPFSSWDKCAVRLSPDVVGKLVTCSDTGWSPEAQAQELVRNQTNIPVPAVRRVLPMDDLCVLVMDYIPGRTLSTVWHTMSIWKKISTAVTLRRYVRELRSIRHPRDDIPGPLGEGREPLPCISSVLFTAVERGPFPSQHDFIQFFNTAKEKAAWPGSVAPALPSRNEAGPLVFSHVDFVMRNLMVGDDGQLWLIDFGQAGFYPPWFEFVNMLGDQFVGAQDQECDAVWRALIPFICDPYIELYNWIVTIPPPCL
ncbi:kinase-like domain-containing protein [Desarmillaria tabescens]|uniref:Kinase-like domain-containing protein n=1 Tax=Armillaria tabescens TaxID=1929756 RepID=A0AA39NDX0_ARMTA|nr:kinase-like domain-containing protein [Desarmillaria tabescens]KAK0463688.1 kinase-like domain-containing protein [Desarmillaria tabescens]